MSQEQPRTKRENLLEDEITAMVGETEARQHELFVGLNSSLTNEAKHAAWECVAAVVNKVGQRDRAVADI